MNPSCNHKIVNTLPFVPPMLGGSCATTQRVWAICVLPVLNSVMDMVGIPPVRYNGKLLFEASSHSLILYKFKFNKFKKKIPPKSESNTLLPVETCITLDLTCENSVPVIKEAD